MKQCVQCMWGRVEESAVQIMAESNTKEHAVSTMVTERRWCSFVKITLQFYEVWRSSTMRTSQAHLAVHSGAKPSLSYSNSHFISWIKSVHVTRPTKVPLYTNELAAVLIFYFACLAGNTASLNPLSTRRQRESQTLYYRAIWSWLS